jgi:hypothetical protein
MSKTWKRAKHFASYPPESCLVYCHILQSTYSKSTTDNQFDEFLFRITYRQRIWQKWLFFEISPQVSLSEDEDWGLTPGITFRMEIFLGKKLRYGRWD